MKLTVLAENNTLIDKFFYGEPGASFLIEDGGKKILLDTGYSDAFIRNALKMGISLHDLDYIVISHGHLDHTWGLDPLVKHYTEARLGKKSNKRPVFVAHPDIFFTRKTDKVEEIGCLMPIEKLDRHFEMKLGISPVWLTERIVYMGEIKRVNDFESKKPIGKIIRNNQEIDDFVIDDSALAYKSEDGLVIITGCSHSGICNIVEQAKDICQDDRIIDIFGGFHLLNPPEAQMNGTLEFMKKLQPKELHACHCTDLNSKIALSKVANIKEVGVGLVIEH